jgi:3-oxoacyl-[acyl-carrier-protein] synthase-3
VKISIDEISYQLGSKTENISDLIFDNPSWDQEKIMSTTGVEDRFVSDKNESALSLGVLAAKKIDKEILKEIDLCIFVSQSPEYALPTTACIIQDRLNLNKNCAAFDINLGCSGFPYALSVVSSMLENHICSKALIICSDTYTKYIKKDNRACRPLFSDAAAAIIVSKSKDSKIGPFILGTDGSGAENLIVRNSASNIENGVEKTLYMNGAEVLLFTMSNVPKGIRKLVKDAELDIEDIDMFFLHQASKVVMSNIQRILKVPDNKFPTNYEKHGNTVSATIPILMAQEAEKGNLQRGMTILLFGFGVGYSYGGCIVEY